MNKYDQCVFEFVCDQSWDDLIPTKSINIKNCSLCNKTVTRCTSAQEVIDCARDRKCIAYDASILLNQMSEDEQSLFLMEQHDHRKALSGIRVGRIAMNSRSDNNPDFLELPPVRKHSLLTKLFQWLKT